MGLEPTTLRLRVSCSTDWASRAYCLLLLFVVRYFQYSVGSMDQWYIDCPFASYAYTDKFSVDQPEKVLFQSILENLKTRVRWLNCQKSSHNHIPFGRAGSNPAVCDISKRWSRWEKKLVTSENRTQAARVAGEHSTTEPTMPGQHKMFSQSVGFEPTLPEGNWFRVSRLNHSATTAVLLHGFKEDEHRWFSGRMLACHAGGPGSIPGRCTRLIFVPVQHPHSLSLSLVLLRSQLIGILLTEWVTERDRKKFWRRGVSIPLPLTC